MTGEASPQPVHAPRTCTAVEGFVVSMTDEVFR
jgi:hypothetical protein